MASAGCPSRERTLHRTPASVVRARYPHLLPTSSSESVETVVAAREPHLCCDAPGVYSAAGLGA
eukprot:1283171-Amphidinium_carterae.3